jgi:hypothetical protein
MSYWNRLQVVYTRVSGYAVHAMQHNSHGFMMSQQSLVKARARVQLHTCATEPPSLHQVLKLDAQFVLF